jgi:hypothetical protein
MIIFLLPVFSITQLPKAAEYFTISIGVSASSALPPIVPLIPEIDLISANAFSLFELQIYKNYFGYLSYSCCEKIINSR